MHANDTVWTFKERSLGRGKVLHDLSTCMKGARPLCWPRLPYHVDLIMMATSSVAASATDASVALRLTESGLPNSAQKKVGKYYLQPGVLSCRTLAYLKAVQAQLVNATAVGNGLRPFEVRLPSGCIQETDANYKGDLVSGVLNNTMDGDQCCQLCRSVPTTLQGHLYSQLDAHRKASCCTDDVSHLAFASHASISRHMGDPWDYQPLHWLHASISCL